MPIAKGSLHTNPGFAQTPASTARDDDGTRQLLRWGMGSLVTGIICAALTETVFGGIRQHGPHTNAGWLALVAAMMCLPMGTMLSLLGLAKWLRKRNI